MDSWSNNNAGHKIATQYNNDPSRRKIEQFTRFRDASKLVDKENHDKISRNLIIAMDEGGFKGLKPETNYALVPGLDPYKQSLGSFNSNEYPEILKSTKIDN